jgi:hypothetical protein
VHLYEGHLQPRDALAAEVQQDLGSGAGRGGRAAVKLGSKQPAPDRQAAAQGPVAGAKLRMQRPLRPHAAPQPFGAVTQQRFPGARASLLGEYLAIARRPPGAAGPAPCPTCGQKLSDHAVAYVHPVALWTTSQGGSSRGFGVSQPIVQPKAAVNKRTFQLFIWR